jgi:hypothetical protein
MLTIYGVNINGQNKTSTDEIREIIESEDRYTILAVDGSGQTNLLSSTDYIGEEFKLKDNSIIKI